MTAGRRVLLSASFLAAAALLAAGTARAQDRPSHRIWGQRTLTPDQVKEALAKMGAGEFGDLDPFQEMVRNHILKNNPGLAQNPQLRKAIEDLTKNPQFMEQAKQIAKQRQTDPGRPGQLTPDDFGKLAEEAKKSGNFPKLPPDIKGFELPKQEPVEDPKVGPMPMTEPPRGVPPKLPELPKHEPPREGEPTVPPPPGPNQNPNPVTLPPDQNPFPPPEEPNDPRTKSLQAFAALWERNIGPLSETPEVQRALFELVGENGFDFDIKDPDGNSIWDLLKDGGVDGSGFGDMFDGAGEGGNWNFGDWEFPKLGNWFGSGGPRWSGGGTPSSRWGDWFGSRSRPSAPRSPSSGWGSGGGSGFSFGGTWLPFVLLGLVILAVFVWFQLKNLRDRDAGVSLAAAGLGPWPVDPRSINNREDVVKAFEYLSVLICGESARNWTHGTIAAALADLAATHEETALMLARLYELARYAPLDEPLSRDELIEARKLVCALAGVSY